jgi:arginine decarboxylase-like protein
LKQLVDRLEMRGIAAPVLLRFRDILQHRLRDIFESFQTAIAQHQYNGRYICVYPIKVNQQRQVVEEVLTRINSRAGHIDATMTLDNVAHVDHLARQEAKKVITERAG